MGERKRAQVTIRGRVQGVFFRMETQRAAVSHDVFGWVKNQPNGAVAAVFEGEAKNVQAMIDWCGKGPALATVDAAEVQWQTHTGEFRGFEVRY